ncbi:MAG: carbon storage regulator [Candidatus Eremiobacterota bacterium]
MRRSGANVLVLSRRKEESLLLGDDIRIVVLELRSDLVRLGIEAPERISILRGELAEEVRRANVGAAELDAHTLADLGLPLLARAPEPEPSAWLGPDGVVRRAGRGWPGPAVGEALDLAEAGQAVLSGQAAEAVVNGWWLRRELTGEVRVRRLDGEWLAALRRAARHLEAPELHRLLGI